MALKIAWSAIALSDYLLVVEYLSKEWSLKVVNDFTGKVDAKTDLLRSHPDTGKRSKQHKDIRSISITSHNRLYYQVVGDTIEILGLIDTRRDPAKNPYE